MGKRYPGVIIMRVIKFCCFLFILVALAGQGWSEELLSFHPNQKNLGALHFVYLKEFQGKEPKEVTKERGECWVQGERWRQDVQGADGKIQRTVLCDGQRTVEWSSDSVTAKAFAARPFPWVQLYLFHASLKEMCLNSPFSYAGETLGAIAKQLEQVMFII